LRINPTLVGVLTLCVAILGCSKSDNATNVNEHPLVTWPVADPINKSGYIVGTDLAAISSHLASTEFVKGKFETTDQFNRRRLKTLLAGKFGDLDLSKNYLVTSLAEWTYDADTQTVTANIDFSDSSMADLGSYSATNAFGAEVTVKKTMFSSTNEHVFYASEEPCRCYSGSTERVLRHVKACEPSETFKEKIAFRLSTERAKSLQKYLQVLAVENFDTRNLIKSGRVKDSLCLIRMKIDSTSATFNNPNDNLFVTTDINARLLRLVLRDDESGTVFYDKAFPDPKKSGILTK